MLQSLVCLVVSTATLFVRMHKIITLLSKLEVPIAHMEANQNKVLDSDKQTTLVKVQCFFGCAGDVRHAGGKTGKSEQNRNCRAAGLENEWERIKLWTPETIYLGVFWGEMRFRPIWQRKENDEDYDLLGVSSIISRVARLGRFSIGWQEPP